MSVLSTLNDVGVEALTQPPDGLRLKGLSRLTTDQKSQIIEFARNHKQAILVALSQDGAPGECESCPAAGYWDHSLYAGQGLICFHKAYFLGKPGKPNPCSEVRKKCPRNNELPLSPSQRR